MRVKFCRILAAVYNRPVVGRGFTLNLRYGILTLTIIMTASLWVIHVPRISEYIDHSDSQASRSYL